MRVTEALGMTLFIWLFGAVRKGRPAPSPRG